MQSHGNKFSFNHLMEDLSHTSLLALPFLINPLTSTLKTITSQGYFRHPLIPRVKVAISLQNHGQDLHPRSSRTTHTNLLSPSLQPDDPYKSSLSIAMLRLLLPTLIALSTVAHLAGAHEHHDDGGSGATCESNPDVRVAADYRPGVVTLDGHADEWADVEGIELPLLPALDPDQDKAYAGGKMSVKALHDGSNVFFMLQIDGEYAYSKGANSKCPSVALMFQVGENASYHNMGGCTDLPGSCTSKSCRGHEVDLMHFSIGTAIPGRLYGGNLIDNREGNGGDRFGHLVDIYAWNPHCRYLDGKGPSVSGNTSNAQNDWQGAWWHSTIDFHSGLVEEDSPYSKDGQKGTYYFEFSRPLRTMDRFQQDAQFVVGQSSKVAVAFWYPVDGKPWSGSQHYSVSCEWLPLDIVSPSTSLLTRTASNGSWDAATAFALLMSVVSFCLSIFVGYWVSKTKSVPFTPIDRM